MRRQRLYGVARADSLVVLALVVFLLAVAGPLASKPRAQASRVVCRANLAMIGKAMLIYAGDYDGALPRAGGPTTEWGNLGANWAAADRYAAYGVTPGTNAGGKASISSCLYLLVKYLEMPTKVFVCPSDANTVPFRVADENVPKADFTLFDAWDFGGKAYARCSYAYHIPFNPHALTTSRDPNLAVAADRNPWIASPAVQKVAEDFDVFWPDVPPYMGIAEAARRANTMTHERDGQNVLFLDGRVSFEPRSFCGVAVSGSYDEFGGDNVYTQSMAMVDPDAKGRPPELSPSLQPRNAADSLLVHDPPHFPHTR